MNRHRPSILLVGERIPGPIIIIDRACALSRHGHVHASLLLTQMNGHLHSVQAENVTRARFSNIIRMFENMLRM